MKALSKFAFVIAAVLALSSFAWAKSNDQSTNKTATVTLSVATTMPDGVVLQPGTYKVTVLNDQTAPRVEIFRNGKLVCKCPITLENLEAKTDYTRLEYNTGANDTHFLTGMAIGGWAQKIVFAKTDSENVGS
jgi:hypothetical protein